MAAWALEYMLLCNDSVVFVVLQYPTSDEAY